MRPGEWWHSLDHDEPCRVVETENLWQQATCVVWLPRRDAVVRTLQHRLVPLRTAEDALLERLEVEGDVGQFGHEGARLGLRDQD